MLGRVGESLSSGPRRRIGRPHDRSCEQHPNRRNKGDSQLTHPSLPWFESPLAEAVRETYDTANLSAVRASA
jgi:hypothetical protein